MKLRIATSDDVPRLALMNKQLIEDEGHRNAMDMAQLEKRMAGWITSGEYTAHIFESGHDLLGYCLFKEATDHIYLRQFFVARDWRRRGFGKTALALLAEEVWHGQPVRVEVLADNTAGFRFWQATGFAAYAHVLERLIPGESVFRKLKKD